jgi:hypothetical protein
MEIFDSAVHPTIDNTWLNPKFSGCCDINSLIEDMKKYKIRKAFAIGLKEIGAYTLENYIKFLQEYKNIIPIAFCEIDYDFNKLNYIKQQGYKGIKIHPRLSGIESDDDRIFEIIKNANKLGLIVLYCGFLGVSEKFIKKIDNEKILFLHTGGKDLEKTFEKLKEKTSILLDLSYTFNRYEQLDSYLMYLFKNHSDRICIGSDHPEVKIKELREKFDLLSQYIDNEQIAKIAYQNIEMFIKTNRRDE